MTYVDDVHLWVRAYTKDQATVAEIARAAGVRTDTVRRHLRSHGVKLRGNPGRPRQIDLPTEDAMLEERERNGTPYKALAAMFGMRTAGAACGAVKRAKLRRDGQ